MRGIGSPHDRDGLCSHPALHVGYFTQMWSKRAAEGACNRDPEGVLDGDPSVGAASYAEPRSNRSSEDRLISC